MNTVFERIKDKYMNPSDARFDAAVEISKDYIATLRARVGELPGYPTVPDVVSDQIRMELLKEFCKSYKLDLLDVYLIGFCAHGELERGRQG